MSIITFSFLLLCFLITKSPVFIAILIVFLAFQLGASAGYIVSKWLFVSVFIVFLGGMIILFFYVLSLSKPMSLRAPDKLYRALIFAAFIRYSQDSSLRAKNTLLLANTFSTFRSQIIVYLALILFIALVVVIQLSQNFKGSLLRK